MNIIITKKDLEKIDLCLNKMVSSSRAHSVLLIDRSGQLIAHHGNTPGVDILIAFGAHCCEFRSHCRNRTDLGRRRVYTLIS